MPPGDAEAKRRQRDRNRTATGAQSRSGSSGQRNIVGRMERRSFDDIQPVAIDGPEFAGQVTDVRMLANRDYSVNVQVPAAYAHELVELGQDSAVMFTFFRSSHVPRRAMLPEQVEGDGDGE